MIVADWLNLIVIGALTFVNGAFISRLLFAKKYFRLANPRSTHLEAQEAPTVSVCIPVRNEHHAIETCLNTVLASNYPKMEVIVLDDDSIDDTSEIVRSFARKGVRFIQSEPATTNWIAKNQAMRQLTKQANGNIIIFLSVDTKITPHDITIMIQYMLLKQLKMLSIMPQRQDIRANVVFGTMRFFWELILHSREHPAASSSIWAVDRQALLDYGNFWESQKNSIRPEIALAQYFYDKHQYHFLIANKYLQIGHEKKWTSQIETTIRTARLVFERLMGAKLNFVIFLIIFIFFQFVVLQNIIQPNTNILIRMLSFFIIGLTSLSYLLFTQLSWKRLWFLGWLIWPYSIIQETILLIIGLVSSKRRKLMWKGRAVNLE